LSPRASFISSRDIYRAGLTSNSKVSDLLLEGTLVWPPDLIARYPALLSVTSPSLVGPRDQQEWRNRSGNIVPFSVNEVWNSIRPMAAKVDWFRVIWFTNCIPRHAINFWLIIKKRLRTQDMLRTWDISGCLATNCPLCDVQPDSHEHLFFDCTLSKNIWDRVKIMAGLSNSSPSIDSIVSDILPFANRRTTRSVIAKLVVAATSYFIWQERNYRLFKKVNRSENQLVECIISSVRFKLMTCRFKKSKDGLAILRQWKLSEMVLS
ncbi:reverse transcriptase domain, reverse transcriptase zinc-binding domain protein, partial [Tanacetum coccineum]